MKARGSTRSWLTPSRSLTWTSDARSSPPLYCAEDRRWSKVSADWPSPVTHSPRLKKCLPLKLCSKLPAEHITFFFFSGFGERLLTEVKKLAPKDVKIKVGPGSMSREFISNFPFKAHFSALPAVRPWSIIVSINMWFITNLVSNKTVWLYVSIYRKHGKNVCGNTFESFHTICVFSPFF